MTLELGEEEVRLWQIPRDVLANQELANGVQTGKWRPPGSLSAQSVIHRSYHIGCARNVDFIMAGRS